MSFSEEQIAQLSAKLDRNAVKTRKEGGRDVSYIEGWHAISEANRIFGFGEWSHSVDSLDCVVTTTQSEPNYQGRDKRDGYLIAYVARVTVTVGNNGGWQQHQDVGYGEGINYGNVGQAHESAIKEAVTDGVKRGLRYWGNVFGLALYDKEQAGVDDGKPTGVIPPPPKQPASTIFDKDKFIEMAKAEGFGGTEIQNLLGMRAADYVVQFPDTTAEGLMDNLRAKRELAKETGK